jgi:hypothetical protein
VYAITPQIGLVNGGDRISITGKYFGFTSDDGGEIEVYLGSHPCYNVVRVSTTEVPTIS